MGDGRGDFDGVAVDHVLRSADTRQLIPRKRGTPPWLVNPSGLKVKQEKECTPRAK